MKKKRFSVEQIVGVLKQVEVGVPVTEMIRKAGIRADVLSLEGEVCGPGSRSGSAGGTTAGREPSSEEACGRVGSG